MAVFLICYSSTYDAKALGWPREGSAIDITSHGDILSLVERFGHAVIFHPAGYKPWWLAYHDLDSPEELEEEHKVEKLPDDYESARWIEVYNHLRE